MRLLFVTVSRSDFSILNHLIKQAKKNKFFDTRILVTGEHLSKKMGYTKNEILKNFKNKNYILKIKDTLLSRPQDILLKASTILKLTTVYIKKIKPELIVLLGDRYEVFHFAFAAMINKIPIAHIHGGEKTTGSLDDIYRHCISKMSNIHFVERKEYKKRLIQLGEDARRIFIVGSLGRENILKVTKVKKIYLEKKYKIKFMKKNIICTYHPENISKIEIKNNILNILQAIKKFPDIRFIFTATNLDIGSDFIRKKIQKFIKKNSNAIYIPNLGKDDYFNFLRYTDGVLGNSSSGIIEVPALNKFSINIGSRQNGRYFEKTVINVPPKTSYIVKSIKNAYSKQFKKKLNRNIKRQNTSIKIVSKLKKIDYKNILKKEFIDL